MPSIGPFHYNDDPAQPDYLPRHHRAVLRGVAGYYEAPERRLRHIRQTTPSRDVPSLRLLDWFLTNYAKKKQTCWVMADRSGSHRVVRAHETYVRENRNWKRVLFDCFQRRTRIRYRHPTRPGGEWHTTTVAQLNFMRFANETGIYAYVEKHRADIEVDMNAAARRPRLPGQRRQELSRSPATIILLPQSTDMRF